MNYQSLYDCEAGPLTTVYNILNRSFIPRNLHQVVCYSENLQYTGTQVDSVAGSSIGFEYESALKAAMGEYFERVSASYIRKHIKVSSYNQLVKQENINVLHPSKMKLYADWQYQLPGFPFNTFSDDHEIGWVEGFDVLNDKKILVPAFLSFFGYDRNRTKDGGRRYYLNTSTGMASGSTITNAIKGGFLECAERHAFTNFWYNQRELLKDIPQYNQESAIAAFPDNRQIINLLKNNRVKIIMFDLSALIPVPTIFAVLFFPYKGKIYMSPGASSRFTLEDAIIKSALEAYQGVEFAISLINDKPLDLSDFSTIDTFEKHFMFYSLYPENREKVPVLRAAIEGKSIAVRPTSRDKITGMHELQKSGLDHLIYIDNSVPEFSALGYNVVRVLTPGWSYLSAEHNVPFLGADTFCNRKNLFLEYPHPFP